MCAVCGSVTNIPARALWRGCAPSRRSDATGLHAAPARNSGLALVPGRPQRAWPAATQLQLRTARPTERCAGPRAGQWADSWAPRQRVRPGRAGCWWLACLVRLLSSAASGPPAGGGWQQPEADFLKCKSGVAQLAEESGSIWARPREACHPTPSQWRARHTGATPQSASRNKRASPRAKSRGGKDTTTAQPVVTSLLTRETC